MTLKNMNLQKFAGVSTWVFDLDQCLYPKEIELEAAIRKNLRRCAAVILNKSLEDATEMTRRYRREYGTTGRGLEIEHGVDQVNYLRACYWEVDLYRLNENKRLRKLIERLPGKKVIFSNSIRYHAERVLKKMGLDGVFDAIITLEDMDYDPKPSQKAFAALEKATGLDYSKAAFFEDSQPNLEEGKKRGMATAHIDIENANLPFVDAYAKTIEEVLEAIHASDVLTS